MLNSVQIKQLSIAWRNLDISSLEKIATDIQEKFIVEGRMLHGFAAHLRGNLSEALTAYEKIEIAQISDPALRNLFEIDSKYLNMKLKRASSKNTIFSEVARIFELVRNGIGGLTPLLIHHALYTWYIRAFWYNQYQSICAGFLLNSYGAISRNQEARIHGRYLFGHILNVMGYPRWGVPAVMNAFHKRSELSVWLHCSFTYMTYGLFMVDREESEIPFILEFGEKALVRRPDPFYRILHSVSTLRAASQAGDIVTAEKVAPFLIEISERTGSRRFLYSSKADLALCYGIRGLLGKCQELLAELNDFDPTGADPVEVGSLLRLRGWAQFFLGNYELALGDAKASIKHFGKSKSFFMAVEMAKILVLVADFRIRMAELKNLNELNRVFTQHQKMVQRLQSRYRLNRILLSMVKEEEVAIRSNYLRFSQPGYSRISNVVVCLQDLQSESQNIINAQNDHDAWRIISDRIRAGLNCEIVEIKEEKGQPSFSVRKRHLSELEVEISIPRTNVLEKDARYDLLRFRGESIYHLPVIIDSLFSLRSTVISQWKSRDLHFAVIRNARLVATAEVARQVGHDIRSPLTALNIAIATSSASSDERSVLIRNAVNRINEIANSLVSKKHRGSEENTSVNDIKSVSDSDRAIVHVGHLIEEIVSEKKLQYLQLENLEIEVASDILSSPLFSLVNPGHFKRMLSNLINNSVESLIEGKGKVVIRTKIDSNRIEFAISDDGIGIPSHLIKKIGLRGFTAGKIQGSGYGLHHAKECLEAWEGCFQIESSEGVGTSLTISLPLCSETSWQPHTGMPTSVL